MICPTTPFQEYSYFYRRDLNNYQISNSQGFIHHRAYHKLDQVQAVVDRMNAGLLSFDSRLPNKLSISHPASLSN